MVANILHITRSDREFEGEAMLKRPDGTTFMGMLSGTSFQWDNDQEGMAFSIHDLTDMKAVEKSLRHSERIAFLGRLVDDISHQIRNPIMVIGGFARRLDTNGSGSKKVKVILDEASRLEQLLDTLNEFIGLRCPEPERISIGDFINLAETTLGSRVKAQGCKWISDYEEGIGSEELLIDKELMIEALGSVIDNACESYEGAAEKKNVIFQIRHSNDPALPYLINVIDNGTGISSEVSSHIFDHFYSTKTKQVGMGLTFARRIVEEQRGVLSVSSSAGEGSIVTFYLVKERRRPLRTTKL
jgi:signal transduction histidine kinase